MPTEIISKSFATLVDGLPSLVFVTDGAGSSLYCNRRVQTFTGLSEQALMDGGWLLAIHEDDRDGAALAWKQAMATEEPFEVEYRLRAADGHFHWFLVRSAPVRSNGQIDHWVGSGTDIHDQKLSAASARAEQARTKDALDESEARYRTIFQSMFNFVGLLTSDGVLVEANDAALRFFGMAASEVVGRKVWETPWWDSEDAADRLRDAVARAAKGEFIRYDTVVKLRDGHTATIDFTLNPVFDPEGGVRRIIAEGRDLTHLMSVEAALRESQAGIQRIVDSEIVGVSFGNRAGKIASVNEGFLQMTGFSREEFDAHQINWRSLTAKEFAERDDFALGELDRNGACTPYEKEYVLRGRRLPVQVSMARVNSPTPDVDHVALIVDLSIHRQAQAELKIRHAELIAIVENQTAELKRMNDRLTVEVERREVLECAQQARRAETADTRLDAGT